MSPDISDYHRCGDGCVDPAAVVRRDGRPRYVVRRMIGDVPVWALAFYGTRPGFFAATDDNAVDAVDDTGGDLDGDD